MSPFARTASRQTTPCPRRVITCTPISHLMAAWTGAVLLLVPIISCAAGESDGRRYTWSNELTVPQQATIELIAPDESMPNLPQGDGPAVEPAEQVLHVQAQPGQALRLTLLVITDPEIKTRCYALRGWIRYAGVAQPGFLEMWNSMSTGGEYFTRTLGDMGPLQQIRGDSKWREVALPFDLGPTTDRPTPVKLTVNLHLPAGGEVWLSEFRLVTSDGPLTSLLGSAAVGWDGAAAGWISGLLGCGLGFCGAAFGVLSGRRGGLPAARWLALVMTVVCGLIFVGGLVAAAIQLPWSIWYPPVLAGAIGAFVFPLSLRSLEQRIRQQELARMQALDA